MTSAAPAGTAVVKTVVRVSLQLDDGSVVGHIAVVKKVDEHKGVQVDLITAASAETHWLPDDLRGTVWDWVDQTKVQVAYEDESSGDVERYVGRVINIDAVTLMLYVQWDADGAHEWVSLRDDEWEWPDVARPSHSDIEAALKRLQKQQPKSAPKPAKSHRSPPQPQQQQPKSHKKRPLAGPADPGDATLLIPNGIAPVDEDLLRTMNAVRSLSSTDLDALRSAAQWLRQYSATGVRAVVVLAHLGALGKLIRHLDATDAGVQQDVAVTLINVSLYTPNRANLCKMRIIEHITPLLRGNEAQCDVGLALLQNISLAPQSHVEIVASGFLHGLSSYFHRAPREFAEIFAEIIRRDEHGMGTLHTEGGRCLSMAQVLSTSSYGARCVPCCSTSPRTSQWWTRSRRRTWRTCSCASSRLILRIVNARCHPHSDMNADTTTTGSNGATWRRE